MKIIAMVLILLCSQHALWANANEVEPEYKSDYSCASESQKGLSFRYCIRHVDRSKNKDIIYFFHGLNGDEETWFKQRFGTGMLERKWHWRGYDPTIVTVSFGGVWLLVNNSRFRLIPYFQQVIMPFLENKVGGLGKGRRMLIGQSMGGFNAIEASIKLPNLFSRVALLCPAITTIGPYSTGEEVQDYLNRTGADPTLVELMISISRKVFVNNYDWDHHDPLKILSHYEGKKPHFYISTGMSDNFGFQEGSELFASIAKKEGFHIQWVPVLGGHCNFDRRTTANFIMEGANDRP